MPLDCRTPEAAAALESAIDGVLSWRGAATAALDRALARERRAPLAQAVRAYDLLDRPAGGHLTLARQALARGGEGLSAGLGSARGAAHLEAARAWAGGRPERAAGLLEDWLLRQPRDLLALAVCQRLYLALGDPANLRDGPARLLDAWDPGAPGYAFVLAAWAFGLAETGAPGEAEAAAVEALALAPEPAAVLAAAAALEQTGRLEEAETWLGLHGELWRGADRLAARILWYLAAMQIDAGKVGAALQLYDAAFAAAEGPTALSDATGLLWRLELVGAEVGARWEPVLAGWQAVPGEAHDPLACVAAVMAAATGGGAADLEPALASLETLAEGDDRRALVLRELGRPLSAALVDFAQGRADEAVAGLLPLRRRLAPLGGTLAQRDVFAQTAIYAALVAGEHRLARALLSERRARRPGSPQTWQATAATFEALGEADKASAALARVRALRRVGEGARGAA